MYFQIYQNTFKYIKISALNCIGIHYQYDEVYYKYIQMHWKKIQILWCFFKYIYLSLKIHCYVLIYIRLPSKYIIVPSKNLTYFLTYITIPLLYSNILPYTSIYVETVMRPLYSTPFCLVTNIIFQNCHGASLFYQDVDGLPWHLCWNPQIKHIPRIPYILLVN
jgi:hypothetical protein